MARYVTTFIQVLGVNNQWDDIHDRCFLDIINDLKVRFRIGVLEIKELLR